MKNSLNTCVPCGKTLPGTQGLVKCSRCGEIHYITKDQHMWIQTIPEDHTSQKSTQENEFYKKRQMARKILLELAIRLITTKITPKPSYS